MSFLDVVCEDDTPFHLIEQALIAAGNENLAPETVFFENGVLISYWVGTTAPRQQMRISELRVLSAKITAFLQAVKNAPVQP
ncbi:MAG: hypothetical protein GXX91_12790 [Verrucomicrobiaceae bacterium]|nr:hypothetical protein [Verrucomicrobiaceae bacterium]